MHLMLINYGDELIISNLLLLFGLILGHGGIGTVTVGFSSEKCESSNVAGDGL